MGRNNINNAVTVDVEDYYQVEGFANVIRRDDWEKYPSRVVQNTEKVLRLFDENDTKGTFFVLGCVAEKNKGLVEEIHSEGHEVACHGYSHKMILKQTREEFREETMRTKSLLEDIIGSEIKGYRAATYSITQKNLWAIDELINAGFKYDSSIFPIKHDRYGISEFNREPCLIRSKEGEIVEFPITTTRIMNENIPVAGGGYFRLYPYWLTRLGLSMVNREGLPFIFYLHPWEVDPDQPEIKGIKWTTKFRHYVNLGKTAEKLGNLLRDFRCGRVDEVLDGVVLNKIDLATLSG